MGKIGICISIKYTLRRENYLHVEIDEKKKNVWGKK